MFWRIHLDDSQMLILPLFPAPCIMERGRECRVYMDLKGKEQRIIYLLSESLAAY